MPVRAVSHARARAWSSSATATVTARPGVATEIVAATGRAGAAIGVAADVGTEAGNAALIAAAERVGPVDLFFANAGVALSGGPELPDSTWDLAWRVNLMAHVYAARLLLPGWLARGEGYLVTTASMAGILTSLGDGAYAATKHAAVGFAEWMAITYGDRGIRVSCLCPGGVDTAMLRGAIGDAGKAAALIGGGNVLQPDDVAETVVAGIGDERFLILSHPEMQGHIERQAGDRERWLRGMRRLLARGSLT